MIHHNCKNVPAQGQYACNECYAVWYDGERKTAPASSWSGAQTQRNPLQLWALWCLLPILIILGIGEVFALPFLCTFIPQITVVVAYLRKLRTTEKKTINSSHLPSIQMLANENDHELDILTEIKHETDCLVCEREYDKIMEIVRRDVFGCKVSIGRSNLKYTGDNRMDWVEADKRQKKEDERFDRWIEKKAQKYPHRYSLEKSKAADKNWEEQKRLLMQKAQQMSRKYSSTVSVDITVPESFDPVRQYVTSDHEVIDHLGKRQNDEFWLVHTKDPDEYWAYRSYDSHIYRFKVPFPGDMSMHTIKTSLPYSPWSGWERWALGGGRLRS